MKGANIWRNGKTDHGETVAANKTSYLLTSLRTQGVSFKGSQHQSPFLSLGSPAFDTLDDAKTPLGSLWAAWPLGGEGVSAPHRLGLPCFFLAGAGYLESP